MSTPNPSGERAEYLDQMKRECYETAGLVYFGKNSDGEDEYIGTHEKWQTAELLFEEVLNEN